MAVAVRLSELLTMSDEQRSSRGAVAKCAVCGVVLQESITGCRPTDDGHVCSTCYFERIGEIIESRPLGVPRTR